MSQLPFASALITGSNRGIGLGMLKLILNSSSVPRHIFATCRSLEAENAKELKGLAAQNSNVHVLEFDMAEVSGPRLSELVKEVSLVVQDAGLSLLINNAGVIVKRGFKDISVESMRKVYEINTIAPTIFTKAFYPLLKQAAMSVDKETVHPGAAVVNISAALGSIQNTTDTYSLPYRASKAALNMVTKALSCEFAADGVVVCSVHPGWVKTDMGGENALLTVEQSCLGMMKVLSSLEKSHSSCFFKYDGTILPW